MNARGMRSGLWVALALAACGDDGGAGGAGAQGAGGGATTTTTSATTTGQGGAVDPGHPGLGEECDPIAQNCADPAAPKCTISFEDPALVPTTCQEAYGDLGEGEPCEVIDATVGLDTCAPGYFCNFVGVAPPGRTCSPLCNATADCGEGGVCALFNSGAVTPDLRLFGTCLEACDFWDNDCPTGTKCASFRTVELSTSLVCSVRGSGGVGDACERTSQCDVGLLCAPSGVCREACDDDHPCGPGESCFGGPLGTCGPPPDGWSCPAEDFADGVTCDCDCGAYDFDCARPELPSTGCDDGETCRYSNVCAPSGWTCNGTFYGTADGCDCGCGIPDPDCTTESVAACKYCSTFGGCNQGVACPGNIDPDDNSQCLGEGGGGGAGGSTAGGGGAGGV